ncbi:deoxyribonuclease V [Methylogaea oryzae]|uniref:Endonuclease V n=1 Tax=Methylogaea oryzae TaxID=1295382 RepID=A0A8D4VLP2_9GAMM|nr:deoxyribonuclease V [Methylogaea oryzae]BBL70143.1 endonuclease V [Methylogaea oryzae]
MPPILLHHPHPWNVTPAEAIAIQQALRGHVLAEDQLPPDISTVAGVDVGFEDGGKITRAAVAVLDYPGLALIDQAIARLPTAFPYVPGLLSFREIPAVLAALEQLDTLPDLILCDGQGYAHPRRFGIACHLGVLTGIATIGVGKSRLVGRHGELAAEKGAWVPLEDKGEIIGAVLRSRAGVSPLYVSIGHRVGLSTALDWVLRCTGRYRLPETTRHAHRLASG